MNRPVSLAAVAVLAFALGACGSPAPAPATGTGMPVDGDSSADACALLTDAEITELLGDHERVKGTGVGGSSCEWSNADHASVSLDIGSPGTAPGGVVPPDEVLGEGEQGPDGISYHGGGYATFAVGDRACHLQVVVDVTGDSDRPVIDRFAALVRERL